MRAFELHPLGGEIIRALAKQRAKEAARTGLHCSTIVGDIMRAIAPKKYGREMLPQTSFSYQELGNILEDIIAARLVRRLKLWTKPQPKTFRGIIGSPDGWCARTRTLDEIKVTWVSETDFFTTDSRGRIISESEKFMAYRLQFLFYALAWGARRVKLHVLFVNGKYPRGGGPIPNARTFIFTFSQRELEANYRQLAIHAIDRGLGLPRKYLRHVVAA